MTTRERESFMHEAGKAGICEADARKILRYGTTLARLAVAQCNGDWPADNGERQIMACEECGQSWSPSVFTGKREYRAVCYQCGWKGELWYSSKVARNEEKEHEHDNTGIVTTAECPDCRHTRLVKAIIAQYPGVSVEFQGDPRGAVVKLVLADGRILVAA